MRKLTILTILISILGSFVVYVPRAKAGLVLKLPSSLGLSTNLAGHWTMDPADISWENGTMADISGNGNKGSFAGGLATTTAPVAGKIGQALDFEDSNTQYVDLGTGINPTAITYSIWVKVESFANSYNAALVRNNSTDSIYSGIWVKSNGKLGIFNIANGNVGYDGTGTYTLQTGTWYHLAYTYDSTNGLRSYVNGNLDKSIAANGNLNTTAVTLNIGGPGARSFDEYWDGLLDEARVYSRALSVAEIKRLYNMGGGLKIAASQASKVTTGLVGYWTFDGADLYESGTVAADKSGNSNNGTLSGFTAASGAAPGKIGQALNFDGTNDEVNLDNLTDFDFSQENAFTISAWVFPDGSNATDNVFSRGDSFSSADDTVYYLSTLNTDGTRWRAAVSDGTNIELVNSDVGTVSVGKWQHLAMVWDGSSLTLYKDRVALFLTTSGTVTAIWDGDHAVDRETSIGAEGRDEDQNWDGKIDEVRVYSRALSAGEIKQLYNQGVGARVAKTQDTQLTTDLEGYWSFNGADIYESGTVAADKSGNGNNGTINGGATTVPGKIGQGLSFDSVDDRVALPNVSVLEPAQTLTLSAWIYPTLSSTQQSILELQDGWGMRIRAANDFGCLLNTAPNGWALYATGGTLSLNRWTHIACTYTSGTNVLYIDGVAVNTSATPTGDVTYIAGRIPTIGATDDGTTKSLFFKGKIDETRIHSRALSASEVKRLYQMGR